MSLVAQGRYDEAYQVASEPNPFPAICGRVCTAPCEDACRRGEFDVPIAIRDLKRFASDHAPQKARKITPPKKLLAERVAIVGAGPTGLSAAYYLARRGYRVTVFDAMPVAGGMMSIGIPDYRLPREELDEALAAGAWHVLLDNLTPKQAAAEIEYIAGRARVELSGNITLDTIRAYATTGADFVSCGAITHQAQSVNLNFRLDLL